MQRVVMTMAMLAGCFSMSLATAADKVVVIPLLDSCSQPKVEVPVVTSAGRIWMALNLGASQVATSSTDPAAYGTLYQWGRFGDGHEYRSSPTISTQSNSYAPGHGRFVIGFPDWLNPPNNNLWQEGSGINNPCPAGFRLPTAAEWETEQASWSSQNAAGAFASPLKLVRAGARRGSDGLLINTNNSGTYWSGTVFTVGSSNSLALDFGSSHVFTIATSRAYGFSVRCLKD